MARFLGMGVVALLVAFAGCAAPGTMSGGMGNMGGMDMGSDGAMSGHSMTSSSNSSLDTGMIEPGSIARLAFTDAGTYAIHCHPHPWMKQNVTVEPGAPSEVNVDIVDGSAASDYGFQPANVTIAPGGTVVYHNTGKLAHTATLEEEA